MSKANYGQIPDQSERFLDRLFDRYDRTMTFKEKVQNRTPAVRQSASAAKHKANRGKLSAPGGEHLSHVQEIAGKQRHIRFFYVLIHIAVFLGLAGKSIHGVVAYGDNILINMLAAVVADLSFLGIVLAMKAQELLSDDMRTAKTLYRVSIADIVLGATVGGIAAVIGYPILRTAYYEIGMAVFMAWQVHLWIQLVAFGHAAIAVREGLELVLGRSMANLRHAHIQTQAYIAQQEQKVKRAESSRKVINRADNIFFGEAHAAVGSAASGIRRAARNQVQHTLERAGMFDRFEWIWRRRSNSMDNMSAGDGQSIGNPLPDAFAGAKDETVEVEPGRNGDSGKGWGRG